MIVGDTIDELTSIEVPDSSHGMQEQDRVLAAQIVEARRECRVLEEFPGRLPVSLEQAYDVQAASIAQWPDDVVGWKVARLPPRDRARFPAERLVGPVFRSALRVVAAGSATDARIHDGGFAVIEAEFVLQLGTAIPPNDRAWSNEDLAPLVAAVYGGAEIASSPMPNVIELGAMAIIPDLGINDGVIVGAEIPEFHSTAADGLCVRVSVDGNCVGEATPGPIVGDPFDALRFLVRHCAARDIELPAGTLVSTGLLTGAHAVTAGSTARVDFGTFGWFDVNVAAISR